MAAKTTIILNPYAKSEKAGPLWYELYKITNQGKIRLTKGPGNATKKAAKAARKGAGIIVAAGGDGTINEVINGIAGTACTLGIIPIGSVNVLARQLGIPLTMAGAWKVIEEGHVETLDLIEIEFRDGDKTCVRRFVQLAGVGLDAHIVKQVSWQDKKRWGPFSYVMKTIQSISEKLPRVHVSLDGGRPTETSFVLVGNGAYYGGPIPVFKKARMDDGVMDVCLFQAKGSLDILMRLQSVLRGAHTDAKGIVYRQCRRMEIESESPVPVEIDGEFVGYAPAKFEVIPQALKILAPRRDGCDAAKGGASAETDRAQSRERRTLREQTPRSAGDSGARTRMGGERSGLAKPDLGTGEIGRKTGD